ncbi:MAG: hypothetical protein ALAOOOJD_01534 [bacterium]|nr:hypothetical protein [bacterium]
MKPFVLCLAAAAFLALTGCLLPERIENRVVYHDKNSPPQVTVIWHNLSSDAEDEEKLQKDFDDLIKDQIEDKADTLESDLFLGARNRDMLIKERKLYLENGKLQLRLTATPANKEFSDLTSGGERLLVLDMEEAGAVETNGKLFKTDRNYIIVWPETQKELYWVQYFMAKTPKDKEEREAWERWKANRPKLIKLFEAYQQKGRK